MAWVAGVDGCKGGWIVVLLEKRSPSDQSARIKLCERFHEVFSLSPKPSVIAIDIPIGLLDGDQAMARECDRLARLKLGKRACCVFNPPSRGLLQCELYEEVQSHGMSRQSFGILSKIREVDGLMTPKLQNILHEAHPELAFMSLAGHAMCFKKKESQGKEERLRALESGGFAGIAQEIEKGLKEFSRKDVAHDDLIDAYVMAWVASRIADGKSQRVPDEPPIDSQGLRMEIWY
jgi:predicted RNase H-like nuclease